MNKRLQQFLSAEDITQSQFADKLEVARASVSHILAGRNKPGWDFIQSLLANYPNLNIEWLLSGKGKMYKQAGNDTVAAESPTEIVNEGPDETIDLFSNQEPAETPVRISVQTRPESNISEQTTRASSNIKATQTQNSPARTIEVLDSERRIAKIVIFYDDNTFVEIK